MNPHPIDHSRLARLERIGGRALVTEMIGTFLVAAPARRKAVQSALATGDLAALADAAHSIVAGAGQLGAMTLMEEARRVEEAARSGDATALGAAPTLLSSFDTALATLGQVTEAR